MATIPPKKTARKKRDLEKAPSAVSAHGRLYQELARKLFDELAGGKYEVGDRLPAEREFCAEYNVSRPTVREAMIALEVQGLIEVRVGSGAYVRELPANGMVPGFNVTAFELLEARILFECETAALATGHITDEELTRLDALVDNMGDTSRSSQEAELADRDFHLLIAGASNNAAVGRAIEELWRLRLSSPECALLHAKSRAANVRPVADEHRAIVNALRSRDPMKARAAMRKHLNKVLEYLLFATEQQAIEDARRLTEQTRARFTRLASL